ncbi:conserved hypothetical protein, membrane [Candidatus Omnitrophus magneticus]|uniref:MtN3 and saliva related transmembrane protein n=1 Tax=Candidatus Omnitrophus magneticus TaxID=1609969 RepID=A0A0F0CWD0_9BACT|nr:conserved hypothetical protein, membrane [Candidatus Omnitrophus magneticus]
MNEFFVELIGMLGAICTTFCFLPQIIKILQTKHARDISLIMYIILTIGVFLWLIYGILIHKWPIILANAVTFIFCAIIVTVKITWENKNNGK